jgi:hypothetical protein
VAFSAGGDGGRKSPEHPGAIRTSRLRQPAIAETIAIYEYTPLSVNFIVLTEVLDHLLQDLQVAPTYHGYLLLSILVFKVMKRKV